MADMWAYCSMCQRWFGAGDDPDVRVRDVTCPVCACSPVRVADHAGSVTA